MLAGLEAIGGTNTRTPAHSFFAVVTMTAALGVCAEITSAVLKAASLIATFAVPRGCSTLLLVVAAVFVAGSISFNIVEAPLCIKDSAPLPIVVLGRLQH